MYVPYRQIQSSKVGSLIEYITGQYIVLLAIKCFVFIQVYFIRQLG